MATKRRALAERRKAVGKSQEQLAALVGVERSTVVRWEAGETTPLPWCRPKLARALAVSLDTLSVLLATPDDFPAEPSDALLLSLGEFSSAQVGMLMERFTAMDMGSRREVLQQLTILSGAVLLQPVRRWLAQELAAVPLIFPGPVSGDDLDALERAVVLFSGWDASGMGGLHRQAVIGQLNAVAETLRESHDPTVRQRLFQITADLAQLAGWMAYDQGLPGVAQRYYLLGLSACQEARSPLLGAKILGDMSLLSTKYRHNEDSLELVHAALYIVPRHDSARVRTELLGVESRVHARLGNQAAAVRAADASIEAWQDAQDEPAPAWLDYLNQAGADGQAANAYIELAFRAQDSGQALAYAERAERHARSARGSRPPGYDRSRALDEVRLAEVRLAQQDLGESVTVAQSALELAAPMSSTLICDRLLGFHGELTARYPGDTHVIRFTEQLHDYVRRVAPHQARNMTAT